MEERAKERDEDRKKGAIPRTPLREMIKEKRHAQKSTKDDKFKMEGPVIDDPFKQTNDLKDKFRKQTLYGYVPSPDHMSPWDRKHPECAARAVAIHDALEPLIPRLQTISNDQLITLDDDALLGHAHPSEYIRKVRDLCINADSNQAKMYDSIFYNREASCWAATQAARVAASIAKLVAEGQYQNGFANIRPPGHHATTESPNGYCLFNNVAIAAKYLLRHKLAQRILIVDYDVHHGQGIQQLFYDTDKVMYFSIHRYENGMFWPNLLESNYDFIGEGDGTGYNINVPLNETGCNDYDYLAIILNVLLPLAYEYKPSIVLVSAGFDACLGDPEGRMNVTPAFYGHLITLLSGVAQGKIVAILEGGYFIPGLAESAVRTVRALLNDPCSKLEYTRHINPSVRESINDVKNALRPYWKCFNQLDPSPVTEDVYRYDKYGLRMAVKKYIGVVEKPPFPLKGFYPINKPKQDEMYQAQLDYIKEERYNMAQNRIGYMLNHESIHHSPPVGHRVQEVHIRVLDIIMKLKDFGLTNFMIQVEFEHTREDIIHPTIWDEMWEQMITTHSASYIYELGAEKEDSRSDIYWTDRSRATCQWSISILCQIAVKIKQGSICHGIGIIRPPGHHAKHAEGGGFCLINNVVVTANYLIRKKGYTKVLIVDFDVHHGDGTQEMTYSRNDIMYISMHRFDDAKFFPKDRTGNYTYVGEGKGTGFNLNIPFNSDKMDNADYLFTWIKLVLPVSYAFNPEIILVSAGFDAGINDPLGNYNVFPEVYGQFIQLLKPIAPLILALEGGYNLETTSLGMVNCVRALLGHPLAMPPLGDIKESTLKTVTNVITVAKPHWPILEVNVLPDPKATQKKPDDVVELYRAVRNLSINN